MINFWFDEIGLIKLEKTDMERFIFLNDKGFDEGLTKNEYDELVALHNKGEIQYRENRRKILTNKQ